MSQMIMKQKEKWGNSDLAGRSAMLNLTVDEAGDRLSGSAGQYIQNLGSCTSDLNTWYTLLPC